jgi:hypothetical protein
VLRNTHESRRKTHAPEDDGHAPATADSFPSVMQLAPHSAENATRTTALSPHPLRQPRIAHHQGVRVELELGREVAIARDVAHDPGADVLVALG